MPNFEVHDARIVSALNIIIHNSQFERKISLVEQKAQVRQFLSRQTDCLLDLRLLLGHWEPMILSRIMPTCSLLFFEMTIFRNSIQSGTEFCCP